MDLNTVLDMLVGGLADRPLISDGDFRLSAIELDQRARRGASFIADAEKVIYLGGNGPGFPIALFAASAAAKPFLPLNYRLSDAQLADVLAGHPGAAVVTDDPDRVVAFALDVRVIPIADLIRETGTNGPTVRRSTNPDDVAVLLLTSGTTAAAKSAVLRHSHLTSYLFGSVEFASADPTDSTIVSVPPYHIAAVANLLSNLYSGRRITYLDRFTPSEWLDIVDREGVTHAMVVPTMLTRIVDELSASGRKGPASLRSLAYGGSKVSSRVLEKALELMPETGFVNAYGLTETSSSIAVLDPESHRRAVASADPAERARLSSVGRPLPGVQVEIRDDLGRQCADGIAGEIYVRGPQVAGEYVEGGSRLDEEGWFHTRDRGLLDDAGYLFVQGRIDDTIIRGGENIAPAEIEEVLSGHPDVLESAVAGIPDEEWGQSVAAFVVPTASSSRDPEELRRYVREHLRSAKTPDVVKFVDELPVTPTGKVLRRVLVEDYLKAKENAVRTASAAR